MVLFQDDLIIEEDGIQDLIQVMEPGLLALNSPG